MEIFVQNVKEFWKLMGTNPTAACESSGAGRNFMDNIKRGVFHLQLKFKCWQNIQGSPPDLQEEALRYMRYLVAEKQKQTSAKAKKESCEPDEA